LAIEHEKANDKRGKYDDYPTCNDNVFHTNSPGVSWPDNIFLSILTGLRSRVNSHFLPFFLFHRLQS
jgi:hypothetical protein